MADLIWEKATEAVANGGKTLTNIYQKYIFPSTIWSGGADTVRTKIFPFAINTDFTIIVNAAAINTNAVTWTVTVEGSGDGLSYGDMKAFTASSTSDVDDKPYFLVYDYDSFGRAPYMRLKLVTGGALGAHAITVGIIPH